MNEVCVVGCGVSGLTSALCLLQEGYKVTIFAEKLSPNTTSNIASAIWFPYKAFPLEKVSRWSQESYVEFEKLFTNKKSGILFSNFTEILEEEVEEPQWKNAVKSFARVDKKKLPQGYRSGFSTFVPIIQTNIYIDFLMEQFLEQGGKIIHQKLLSLSEIHSKYKIIVNCSGFGAKELVPDNQMTPIRGQLISIFAPQVTDCIAADTGPLAVAYIVKREQDVILGGTAEYGEYDLTPNEEVTKEIIRKCKILDPKIGDNPKINEVKVGLRPGRTEVRVEKEILNESRIVIHNYGHGGSGITVSWGCAREVITLL